MPLWCGGQKPARQPSITVRGVRTRTRRGDMADWLPHCAVPPLRSSPRPVQAEETPAAQEGDRRLVQGSETTGPHACSVRHPFQRKKHRQTDAGSLPWEACEGQTGRHPQAGTQTGDGVPVDAYAISVDAHVQASAAQTLYQQGEVNRLAWERYTSQAAPSPIVTPIEEFAKAYEDSRGRGRDSRGAMLDVRA